MSFGGHSRGSLLGRVWLVLSLLGSLAQSARAQPAPGVELSWTAPDDCPDQARVQAQIARLAPSPAPREQPLRIQGTVRRKASGFTLELVLQDGEFVGRRRFESDSCTEVVGAAAVTIALLLSSGAADAGETSSAGASSETGAASGAAAQAQSEAPPTSSTSSASSATGAAGAKSAQAAAPQDSSAHDKARAPASGEKSRWRWVLAAPSVSAGFGLLPPPSFGLGLGFALEDDRWRLFASGTWNFKVTLRASNTNDLGAEISRGTGRMGGCRWMGSERWGWAPCAAVAVHYLTARGVGPGISAEVPRTLWVALGPSLLGRLRLSDAVGLAASAGLEVQTARPKFVLEGMGEIEQIGALELTSLLGAEWIF